MLEQFLAVLAALVSVTFAADVEVKTNWQDLWRNDLNKCVSDNADLFKDRSGKPRTRKLGEMAKLISDQIAGKASTVPPASTTPIPSKLSRKERMKQELKQQLSGDLETVFQDIESAREKTAYYHRIRQQGEQMIQQMSRQSKLSFDTDFTLREWCDLVWRSGRFSPLDQDGQTKASASKEL